MRKNYKVKLYITVREQGKIYRVYKKIRNNEIIGYRLTFNEHSEGYDNLKQVFDILFDIQIQSS